MKKILVLLFLCSLSFSANAKDLTCLDRQLADAQLVATFSGLNTDGPISISLGVPTGKTSAKHYTAECTAVPGAIEGAWQCNVLTGTDSGYRVTLYSPGGGKLMASMTPWSMAGFGKATVVPCE